MAQLRYCERARKEAKGYDRVSTTLISLLKLPVRAGDKRAIIHRVSKLTRLFLATSASEASKLVEVLTDLDNDLGRLFKCRLSTELRDELVTIHRAQAASGRDTPSHSPRRRPVSVITVVDLESDSPLVHPRYVDNVAVMISVRVVLAEWVLIWRHNGLEQVANIPRNMISKGGRETLLWAVKVFDSKEDAQREAKAIEQFNTQEGDGYSPEVITFYKGHGNTIRPILYTPVTAPRLFAGIKMYIEDGHLRETVGIFLAYYEEIKDFVNPFFFDIDENGELSVSGPPKVPKLPKLKVRGIRRILRRSKKPDVEELLRRIEKKQLWVSRNRKHRVYETEAGQIVGSFKALQEFRKSKQAGGRYDGWDRHHIVEERHLKALGVADKFPDRPDLPCVLLPGTGHKQRIAGALTEALGSKQSITDLDVFEAYAKAYAELGDYTGSGASAIQKELRRVVGNMLELD